VMFKGINKFLVINVFEFLRAFSEAESGKLGVTLPAKQASALSGERAAHVPTEIVVGSMLMHVPR